MRAVIFANGALTQPELTQRMVQSDDLIIAADGGARHCWALGLKPQIAIGDFDSLSQADLTKLEKQGARLLRHPERKDYTDLELALHYACEQGYNPLLVFGALGLRWDQTLANLLLPASAGLEKATIILVDGLQEIQLIRPRQTIHLLGEPGDIVSLIPLRGEATGVTTRGLEYSLHGETLYFGAARGVSNVLLDRQASVSLEQGLLLCTIIHTTSPK